MKKLRIALAACSTLHVRHHLREAFQQLDISFVFESDLITAVKRTLDLNPDVIIIDADEYPHEYPDFFRLIKGIRPRIPIISMHTEEFGPEREALVQAGADYVCAKTLSGPRITSTVQKIMEGQPT